MILFYKRLPQKDMDTDANKERVHLEYLRKYVVRSFMKHETYVHTEK